MHDALPSADFEDVDLSVDFLGRRIGLPLLISGMTGGHDAALAVNVELAKAAAATGAMIGVGSQRAALLDPRLTDSYAVVRAHAPDAYVLANIGISQLVPQRDSPALRLDDVLRAIDMVRADALAVHLNYLEEIVQPEGQTRARGAAAALADLVKELPVPVVAKETGAGMSRQVALRLRDLGVQALDVGGSGGTSFAAIEAAPRGVGRRHGPRRHRSGVRGLGDPHRRQRGAVRGRPSGARGRRGQERPRRRPGAQPRRGRGGRRPPAARAGAARPQCLRPGGRSRTGSTGSPTSCGRRFS